MRRLLTIVTALFLAMGLVNAAAAELPPLPPPVGPPPSEQPQPQPPPDEPPPPQYPPLPEGSGDGRRVVYDKSEQRVWLVEQNNNVSGSWLVSGRRSYPPTGTFSVFSRSRYSSSGKWRLEYMVRFYQARGKRAVGFHSIPEDRNGNKMQSESELGQPRSAGCVRQKKSDAAILWDWAPNGTKVVVTP